MEISLLAIDLDGSALLDDHKTFTPRLYDALAAAAQKGVAIVPTTGRQYAMLPPAVRTGADWEDLCVLCNGGEVRRLRTGGLLEAHYIGADAARQVIEITAHLGLSVELSAGGLLYLTQKSWDMQREHEDCLRFHLSNILTVRGRTVSSLEEVLRQPGLALDKVNLPYIPEGLQAEVEALLKNAPSPSPGPAPTAWKSPTARPPRPTACWRPAGFWALTRPAPWPSATAATTSPCSGPPLWVWPWEARPRRSRTRRTP